MSGWADDDNFDAGLEAERQADDDYHYDMAVAHAMEDRERDDDDRRNR